MRHGKEHCNSKLKGEINSELKRHNKIRNTKGTLKPRIERKLKSWN